MSLKFSTDIRDSHGAQASNITVDPHITTTESDWANFSKSIVNPSDW